jgi:hypothetical protein
VRVSQPVRTLEHCLWRTRSGYNPALRPVRAPAAALLCTALRSRHTPAPWQPPASPRLASPRPSLQRLYIGIPSTSSLPTPLPHLALDPSPPHVGSACVAVASWLWPHPPHMAADGRLKISCRDGCLLNSRPSSFGLRPAVCQKHRRPRPLLPLPPRHCRRCSLPLHLAIHLYSNPREATSLMQGCA